MNPNTNLVYVANYYNNSVSVINATNNTITANLPVGLGPRDISLNPETNTVYVANYYDDSVSVIDGEKNKVETSITAGEMQRPFDIAVNPVTNQIYVSNSGSNTASIIDGTTNILLSPAKTKGQPFGLAVNPETGFTYASRPFENKVLFLEPAPLPYIQVGENPVALDTNPKTHMTYVVLISTRIVFLL